MSGDDETLRKITCDAHKIGAKHGKDEQGQICKHKAELVVCGNEEVDIKE